MIAMLLLLQMVIHAYMENNRTIYKAERLIYAAVIPSLLSPVSFNSNGTMTDTSVAFFENIASQALRSNGS